MARWVATRKSRKKSSFWWMSQPNSRGRITLCPRLEIGNSSAEALQQAEHDRLSVRDHAVSPSVVGGTEDRRARGSMPATPETGIGVARNTRFPNQAVRKSSILQLRYLHPSEHGEFGAERTRTLPLIPLDDAVVLPNMALAVSISTTEARAAIDDALSGDAPAHVVLVTRRDGRFARIGTVAELDGHPAILPGGARGITIRALHRAELGRADAAGQALRIEVTEHPDPDDPSDRAQELAHEYRAILEEILEARGNPASPRSCGRSTTPGALADTAGYSPDLGVEQQGRAAGDARRRGAAGAGARLGQGARSAELEWRRRIRNDVTEGMEKQQREFLLRQQMDAIRKELGERRRRTTTVEELPRPASTRADLPDDGRARRSTRELDRLERTSEQNARGRLDPHLARHGARPAVGRRAPRTTSTSPRRRAMLDADHAGLDDVKDRILEYLAVRKRRAERGLRRRRRPRHRGADPRAGRPARRRQDLARRVGRPGAGPQVRARRASAASATRPRSAATGAPTSARCPAASSGP